MKVCLISDVTGESLREGPTVYLNRLASALQQDHQVVMIRPVPRRSRLRATVVAERPDIVHIHQTAGLSLDGILAAVDAGRFDRVPVAITLHDYGLLCVARDLRHPDGCGCAPRLRCRISAAFNRAISAPVGLVHSPSQFVLDQHLRQGFFRQAARLVLPYAHSLSESLSPRSLGTVAERVATSFHILFLGTTRGSDGSEVLIRAFRRLPDPSLRLHLAGAGSTGRTYQSLADGDPRIEFHGALEEPAWHELLRGADCAVAPSLWPANPALGIVDAFVSGAAVIASRVGGIPEVLRDGINGLLVEPGDEQALAGAIERVHRSPDLAARLRTEAGKTAHLYAMAFHTAHLTEAYARLIAANRVGPFMRKAA